jgi:hypothetical protein
MTPNALFPGGSPPIRRLARRKSGHIARATLSVHKPPPVRRPLKSRALGRGGGRVLGRRLRFTRWRMRLGALRVPAVYLTSANWVFLAFFAFNGINNLRVFNVAFSSIPTAPTKFFLAFAGLLRSGVSVDPAGRQSESVPQRAFSGAGRRNLREAPSAKGVQLCLGWRGCAQPQRLPQL